MIDRRTTEIKSSVRRQHYSCLLYNQPIIVDEYEKLANAIIEQAVKDYRQYSHDVQYYSKNSKHYKHAAAELPALERFFTGQWFAQLTSIDGKWLLDQLKEEAKNGNIKKTKQRHR